MRPFTHLLLLLLCCAGYFAPLQAQYETAKEGLSARLIYSNYQLPLENGWNRNDFSTGFEIEYLRRINSFMNISLPVRLKKAFYPTNTTGDFRENGEPSADLLLHFRPFDRSRAIMPYVFGGISGIWEANRDMYTAIPLGAGIDFRITQNTYLSTQGSYRIAQEVLRDHLHLGLGLKLMFGEGEATPPPPADRDGDGIPDAQDLCPDQAGPAATQGCPDQDGDGVVDASDKCPTVAGLRNLMGCPDRDGDGTADPEDACPDEAGPATNRGCPVLDRDGDGVLDSEDACPDQPGVLSAQGCPDRDGDGVADSIDLCPDSAGPAVNRGCPDTDGDGVLDKDDRCPNTPGLASNRGCPVIAQEDQAVLDLAVQAVEFETGSSNLKSLSYTTLDQVVDIMRRYPDYKCRIGGHTDSIGSESANQSLSERRAKSCYDYLIVKGIPSSRLSYQGFGESKPIADNRFMDGREKNRRVEFELFLD